MATFFNFPSLYKWSLSIFLVLPWLGSYTAGPSPSVWPWLLSAACAVILWLFRERLSGDFVAVCWVLAAAISAVIGLMQYFGLAPVLGSLISQTGPGEAFANLRQRNQFATLTSIGMVALIALRGRQILARHDPWWTSALVVLLALGNAASGSRTGLLQWVLIGLFTAWWARPDRRVLLRLVLLGLIIYGIALFALPWLLELVAGVHGSGLFVRLATSPGCSSRMVLWSNVLTLIAQKPWFGWGWGELDYAHFITLYPGMRFCEILDNAHNLPLHLAVELGIPVSLTIFSGLGWLVWRTRPWCEKSRVRQMAWGVLAVILLHSLLEYPLWYGPFQIAAGLCVGLLWTGWRADQADCLSSLGDVAQRPSLLHYSRVVLAMLILAALAAAALSYHQVSQIYLLPAERSDAYRDDTLNKIRGNRLFRNQARFAELSMIELRPSNATEVYTMAKELLHYSPESRVIEKLIESATMLGREDEALQYLVRYRAAFPENHASWAKMKAGQ